MMVGTPAIALASQRVRPFLVMLGCILGLLVSVGPIFMLSFSVFLPVMAAKTGWGRGEVSSLIALTGCGVIVGAILIGPLLPRYGARSIISGGSTLCLASLACLAVSPLHFPLFAILFFMAGLTGTGTQTFVYMSLVAKWFDRRLGLMLGIAMTGIGLGSVSGPIIAERLISVFGWQHALAGIGVIMFVASQFVALFLLRDPPVAPLAEDCRAPAAGRLIRHPLGLAGFWPPAVIFTLMAATSMGIIAHFPAIVVDRGLSPAQGAQLVAASGISLAIARLCGGYLLDRMNPFIFAATIFAGCGLSITVLLGDFPVSWLVIVPLAMGIISGIEGDMMPFIAKRYFRDNFELVYSWLFSLFCFGHLAGGVIMGVCFDRFGSYRPALLGFIAASAVSAAISLLMIRTTRKADPIKDPASELPHDVAPFRRAASTGEAASSHGSF